MQQQGRNLSLNTRCEVRLLYSQLLQLGYIIPNEELEEAVLGSVTHQTIMEFQRKLT